MLIAVTGAVVATGFVTTVGHALGNPAATGDPWQVLVSRHEVPTGQVETALRTTPGVGGWYSETERRGSLDGETFQVRALGGDPPGYLLGAGHLPAAPDEVTVGYGLLKHLGLRVDQPATLEIAGEPRTVRVVGWYRTGEDSGDIMLMRLADLRGIDPTASAEQYRVEVAAGTSAGDVLDRLARRLGPAAELKEQTSDLPGQAAIQASTGLIAGILAVVALANMLQALLAGNRESARATGVAGALGFTPRQLVTQGAIGATALGVLALAVGLPVGLLLFRVQSDLVTTGVGIGPGFGVVPSVPVVAGIAVVTLALCAAAGVTAAAGLARRPASDLLRWE